ncbi:NB-ARC domain-containing protein [Tumidithrix elongata RA019]|uniref:NB-ARC domain-containing protein n=1 Tax=Tumidithrix elongata BACA0141 TaxID=2716417 RepID=A0AAW9Q522_9CYAN|nr:NB-ARC domain-containing protein [Tumidithrix elongata RA019]
MTATLEEALIFTEKLVFDRTGDRLSPLQSAILKQAWHGQKYGTIAESYGYTEGHVKDVGAQLWQLLSELLGEKVTKNNFPNVLDRLLPNFLPIVDLHQDSDREVSHGTKLKGEVLGSDRDFVGRASAIAYLQTLEKQGAKIVLIQAQGGVGKTTLARRYLQQKFGEYLEFAIAKETANITSVESLVEERLRQLGEEPGREFGISLDRLKRKLQNTRIGILIDNLEPALDVQGKLIAPHRRYVELLQTLSDPSLQSLTLITSRDRLCEAAISLRHYLLPSLKLRAWQDFFGNMTDIATLQVMHKAYGGNAKAMEIMKSAIALDFDGDMSVYWQEYGNDPLVHADLADLVTGQFQRLQQLDPEAYRLLVRLGCYRYQDIPTVPTEALLSLLWDVPPSKRRHVVESLRNRSLVEFHRHSYWLHPAIRAEAIARLRASEDVEITNVLAAEFWSSHIETLSTVEHALTAFEAYYHYLEIGDYEGAANVILQRRPTKLSGAERLGRSFYQLGLLQQMMAAISQIIPKVDSKYYLLSGLYSILGVLYRLSGQIHEAIACHQKSGAIAAAQIGAKSTPDLKEPTFRNLKNWQQHALLNTGICQIELWELEQALSVFEELLTHQRLTADNLESLYNPSVDVLAAYVYSCLGETTKAHQLADGFHQAIQTHPQLITGHRLLFLGLTYKKLGDTIVSQQLFQQAIAYADEHNYTQVRANALSGLAEIYRHRQDFETAIAHHFQAVELLEQIGTKCDLAEAHFQLGLTLQECSSKYPEKNYNQKSQSSCDRAIQLFTEMSAPKQVEKVKNSLNFSAF